ncbi:hypothetical protein I79_019389 [Cricetulus griseus]|uniref:Uncharacterized protein n=1 Tax=Cricetulus griseus TaxID=10029 RepID=G3I7A2_CRIGR|nr:hypothetical protein I79_019389 [Cricetulus griseus]
MSLTLSGSLRDGKQRMHFEHFRSVVGAVPFEVQSFQIGSVSSFDVTSYSFKRLMVRTALESKPQ